MNSVDLAPWRHDHVFLGAGHQRNERRTWIVVAVTAVMMVGEIAGGSLFGSMALVADGWHMASHAGALMVTGLSYRYARKYARDPRFTFGTGKFGDLAGFASAVVLGVIALLIGWESLVRIFQPRPIKFDQAIAIAALGLIVNIVSAWLLHADEDHDHGHHSQAAHHHDDHDHDHDHDHDDEHDDGHHPPHHGPGAHAEPVRESHGHHHDHNLRAAYLHVLADALTSVLAILGLLAGRFLGWTWMDPLIGILGAVVISQWSWSLMRAAGASLVDASSGESLASSIRARLETDHDKLSDLHIWRLGPGHQAVIVGMVSTQPASPAAYKARLAGLQGLSHITVEVNTPD